MFRFAFQHYLIFLVLVPALIVFYAAAWKSKKKAMSLFGNLFLLEKLSRSVSRKRQIWKIILIVLSVGFLLLALARPQFGTRLHMVTREGQDVIIALDVSRSMLAEDIQPNRLARAKHAISALIEKFQGDRIGLIAFAGKAYVQCPLTLDYGAVRMFLNIMNPDLMPVPGTDVSAAIQKAMDTFTQLERKHKVLILITDGEDHEGDPPAKAKEAVKEGIVIYSIGIGSPQGVPIPEFDNRGNQTGFKRDDKNEVIMTRLDEMTLEKMALETGGKYYRISTGQAELDRIVEDISEMEKKVLSARQFAQYEDRFQFFLGLGIVLLLIEMLLSERKRIKKTWTGRFK